MSMPHTLGGAGERWTNALAIGGLLLPQTPLHTSLGSGESKRHATRPDTPTFRPSCAGVPAYAVPESIRALLSSKRVSHFESKALMLKGDSATDECAGRATRAPAQMASILLPPIPAMYWQFYDLQQDPFQLSPDPASFFPNPHH